MYQSRTDDVASFPVLPGAFPGISEPAPPLPEKEPEPRMAPSLDLKDLQSYQSSSQTSFSGPAGFIDLSIEKEGKGSDLRTRSVAEFVPNEKVPETSKVSKSKSHFEPDIFLKWLAHVLEKLSLGQAKRRQKVALIAKRLCAPLLTVGAQRIDQFLSSLPEQTAEYEDAFVYEHRMTEKQPLRSSAISKHADPSVRRSRSQDNLLTSSKFERFANRDRWFTVCWAHEITAHSLCKRQRLMYCSYYASGLLK